ncbi:YqcI/YcgG family protein [Kitasatospora sp. Ki12]
MFAQRSTIWAAPDWNGSTLADAMDPWSRALAGFAEACRREALDGVLMSLPSSFGATVNGLAYTTRQIVEGLAARDPRGRGDARSPEREGWYFSFAGERMFVIAMASCYSPDHARHTFGEPFTFLLLQPDSAFERAVSPGSDGLISGAVRSRIRELYARHGRPCDVSITLSPCEAHRFVKPAALGDPPVRWWESVGGVRGSSPRRRRA